MTPPTITGRIITPNIFLKFQSGVIAMLSPTPRRTWRVDLLGQEMRFELPETMPLRVMLAAIEGMGGDGW